ncbi:RNA-binding RNA annealing protein [Neocucurbitaria cava]|uniref:RNA-binding RNA annealing protein n=1 Tax=Neocucurbitaria cava TaxID=798079 RepID=A0A9W8Y6S2_9PLEO|nr:RNA-binding RNA annealing protein [Neocucurbitaria cava]
MSNKMEQSLDEILKANKSTTRRGRGGRRPTTGRAAASAAPVGGVSKSTKPARHAKATPSAPAVAAGGETKIMVSNLPLDVEQSQLQDYFQSAVNVGRPKKILMQYGPNGRSLGSATVIFNKHDQAVKATAALNGVKIDGRPVRVEMLVSAANIPLQARQPSLAERVTYVQPLMVTKPQLTVYRQPKKDKPKPATAEKTEKAGGAAGRGRGRGQTRGRGRGRGGREARTKKTTQELDAEMEDYFPSGENNATNGAEGAQASAGGDTAMDEEML